MQIGAFQLQTILVQPLIFLQAGEFRLPASKKISVQKFYQNIKKYFKFLPTN